jgi:hypothetical protein
MSEANSILSMPEKSFRWYLTGLTDGEGCFFLTEHTGGRRQAYLSGITRVSAGFTLVLRGDDASGLSAIRERMGIGVIRAYGPARTAGPNVKPTIRWIVSSLEDFTDVLIPHFEGYPLRLKKVRDYVIWRRAVRLLVRIKRRPRAGLPLNRRGSRKTTAPEFDLLLSLCKQLRATREYDSSAVAISPMLDQPEECVQVEPDLFAGL